MNDIEAGLRAISVEPTALKPAAPTLVLPESAKSRTTSPVSDSKTDDQRLAVIDSSRAQIEVSIQRPPQEEVNGDRYITVPEKPRRSPSPLVLVPSTAPEPHSSPTSTNGAASSHTTAPTAGSPNTSPGEEHVTSASRTFTQEDLGDTAHSNPSLVESDSQDQIPVSDTLDSTLDVEMIDQSTTTLETPPGPSPKPGRSNREQLSRLNTQTDDSYFKFRTNNAVVESPAQITSTATPRRTPMATPSIPDPSKRATRISSGALQKKSVSEILGETPKLTPSHGDSPLSSSTREAFQSATSQARLSDRERREKERTKLSTVVFAKPQRPVGEPDTMEVTRHDPGNGMNPSPQERDYLYTLFENKAYSMTRQGTLGYLIQNAHKTLSTTDQLVDYEYQTECRILKRLYQLQNNNRWALRQFKRADEAPRPTSHWDFVLDHMKWMRTDFREERKWKLAAAKELSEWCVEWVSSTSEERKRLQVRIRQPDTRATHDGSGDVHMENAPGPALSPLQSTPELVTSAEDDSASDDVADPRELSISSVPAAIFSLGATDFNFAVDRTPAFDKLLDELPLYAPVRIGPDLSRSNIAEKLDSRWRTDIVPVSRYATEKLHVQEQKPPTRRSRYEYTLEPLPIKKSAALPPEDVNVALFMPENKHIRDRIHPGHSFRPPSEHPMPLQNFFETRKSSQWTHAEDDELRKLVKDYSYNWSLISSCLTPPTMYCTGPERRSPWECFERWIGLEGLPADMSKTPYFKTYAGRIEAAARHVTAQADAAAQRAGNVQLPTRKRTTAPVRVERKPAQRHLAMLDAMRKLAKKRETALQKQQHQADLAAMRKVNEANQPKPQFKTPAQFSQMKYDREQKMAERQELYRQQLLAHQRATAQQHRSQNGQPGGLPNGVPVPGVAVRGVSANTALASLPNGNLGVPNGIPRTHPGMLGMPNGIPLPAGMTGPKGLAQAQAQMQANMARGMASSPQQLRVQQEQLIRQQQAAQNGSHSSPNASHASMANGNANNPAFMAAMAATNGVSSPSGMYAGNAGSPRAHLASMGQPLSSGHMPVVTQIANKYREQYPNWSDEEIQRAATAQITQWQQQATAAAAGQNQKRQGPQVNQAALNAAMGAVNAGAHASNAAAAAYRNAPLMTNEQVSQYNQRMRMQQQAQHGNMQGQMPPGMVGQMTNSPVMNMARPTSQHTNQGQMSRSATPRDQGNSGTNMNANGVNGVNGGSGQQGSPRAGQQSMQA